MDDLFQWEQINAESRPTSGGVGFPQVYTPRTGHVVISYRDKFYLFGGTDGSARQSDAWVFDPALRKWSACSGPVPAARSGAQAVVYGERVWFFGGYTRKDGEYFNDVYSFHLRNCQWEPVNTIGEAPGRRTDHSVVLYGRCMYVFGGFDGRNRWDLSTRLLFCPGDGWDMEFIEIGEIPFLGCQICEGF